MIWLGIDPDMSGGLVAAEQPHRRIVWAAPMPVLKKRVPVVPEARIDPEALYSLLLTARKEGAQMVVLERAVVRPQVGAGGKMTMQGGIHRTHQNFGAIRAICELAFTRSRVMLANPSDWKSAMGLSSDKTKSRTMAVERYPSHTQLLSMVKNTGLAEAVLMTEWAYAKFQVH